MVNNKLEEILEELQNNTLNPELIQDNKLHFYIEKQVYRIVMPNQRILSQASTLRNKMYFKLIQEKNDDGSPTYLMEKNLINVLKEHQDIDILSMDKEIKILEEELIQKYLSLAKVKDTDTRIINKLKAEKDAIVNKRQTLVIAKAEYLAPSIQNQVNDEYYKYLTSVCTEKHVEKEDVGEWVKVWKTYDEYINDNSHCPYISLGRLTELMLNA